MSSTPYGALIAPPPREKRSMPYLVSTSFERFVENLTIPSDLRKLAETRRASVAELLAKSFDVLEAFSTGSIPRQTGLKGVSDIDAMTVLHFSKHVDGKSPMQLLESVRDVLADYNAQIVRKNGQAVTLYFTTWPNVDIVPAKRVTLSGGGYQLQIPDANTGEWISTDPRAHDRTMLAASMKTRQLVRMMKCWNGSHSDYMSSFDIQRTALATWINELDTAEAAWPWTVKSFFEKAIDLTGAMTTMSAGYGLEDWRALRSRLARGKELALDAWYNAHNGDFEGCIERCRILFGAKFPAFG